VSLGNDCSIMTRQDRKTQHISRGPGMVLDTKNENIQKTDLGEDDDGLMQSIASGDERAFAILVQRYLQKVIHLAFRYVGDMQEAEDVAQEAFNKVWKQAPKWQSKNKGGSAKFSTWFYRVVINQAIDFTRKKKAIPVEHVPEVIDETHNAQKMMETAEKSNYIRHAIEQLPERQKMALILCFYEDHSNKQAAEYMEVSLKALESLLVRARRALKESLKNWVEQNENEI